MTTDDLTLTPTTTLPTEPLRVRPQQARSREKVDRILDAAAVLIADEGLGQVTSTRIAREAGLPPATVYHYFKDRDAILMALASRTMERVDAAIVAAMPSADDHNPQSWLRLIDLIYEQYRATPGFVPMLAALRSTAELRSLADASNRRVAEFLADRLLQGAIRLPRPRLERIALMLSDACQALFEKALLEEPDEARAIVAELKEMIGALLMYYHQLGLQQAR